MQIINTAAQPRRAVVLGGGGSKGSYEIGVWQALHELGMEYHVVTGTSVGALNGALMAMRRFDEALEMWQGLDNTKVMAQIPALDAEGGTRAVLRAFMAQMLHSGGVDVTPLEETIRRLVDEDALRSSGVEFGIVTVQFPTLRPVEWFLPQIPQGQVADFLLASAACFPAFKPKEINGTTFIDGGYTDNIPVDLVLQAVQPVDEIIAVDVEGIGIVRRSQSEIPVTTLRCYWGLGSILIFDSVTIHRNIRLGYLDTMKAFGGLGGHAYAFAKGESDVLIQRHLQRASALYVTLLNAMEGDGKKQLGTLVAGRILGAATYRRPVESDQLDLHGLLLAGAELAAELLGVAPTMLYTADSFDAAVLDGFGQLTVDTAKLINGLSHKRTLNLALLVSHWKKEHQLAVYSHLLHRFLQGNAVVTPQLLATLLPREFLAAVYIEAMLY